MSCTDPGTTTPGSLVLYYSNTGLGINASVSWNLIAGTDLNDVTNLEAEAQRLADLLGPCMIATVHITDWAIKVHGSGVYYGAPLPTPVVGAHAVNGNMQAWVSTTVAFVGTGNQSAAGVCHGKSISRIHTFGALDFIPRSKFYDASNDAAYLSFVRNGLNASTYLPADAFGQQAEIKLALPVQWNAAYQRRLGS